MKISSASKKVLASALSAAMVVAFAPTVALATPNGDTLKVSYDANGGSASPAGLPDQTVNIVKTKAYVTKTASACYTFTRNSGTSGYETTKWKNVDVAADTFTDDQWKTLLTDGKVDVNGTAYAVAKDGIVRVQDDTAGEFYISSASESAQATITTTTQEVTGAKITVSGGSTYTKGTAGFDKWFIDTDGDGVLDEDEPSSNASNEIDVTGLSASTEAVTLKAAYKEVAVSGSASINTSAANYNPKGNATFNVTANNLAKGNYKAVATVNGTAYYSTPASITSSSAASTSFNVSVPNSSLVAGDVQLKVIDNETGADVAVAAKPVTICSVTYDAGAYGVFQDAATGSSASTKTYLVTKGTASNELGAPTVTAGTSYTANGWAQADGTAVASEIDSDVTLYAQYNNAKVSALTFSNSGKGSLSYTVANVLTGAYTKEFKVTVSKDGTELTHATVAKNNINATFNLAFGAEYDTATTVKAKAAAGTYAVTVDEVLEDNAPAGTKATSVSKTVKVDEVTLDLNGGKVKEASSKTYKGTVLAQEGTTLAAAGVTAKFQESDIAAPSKTQTLKGWSVDGAKVIDPAKVTVNGNVALKALWQESTVAKPTLASATATTVNNVEKWALTFANATEGATMTYTANGVTYTLTAAGITGIANNASVTVNAKPAAGSSLAASSETFIGYKANNGAMSTFDSFANGVLNAATAESQATKPAYYSGIESVKASKTTGEAAIKAKGFATAGDWKTAVDEQRKAVVKAAVDYAVTELEAKKAPAKAADGKTYSYLADADYNNAVAALNQVLTDFDALNDDDTKTVATTKYDGTNVLTDNAANYTAAITYIVSNAKTTSVAAADVEAAQSASAALKAAKTGAEAKAALEAYNKLTAAQKALVSYEDVAAAQKIVSDAEAAETAQKVKDSQDLAAARDLNGKKVTAKAKVGKKAQGKSFTYKLAASESGATASYAKVSGSKYIKISKSGKVTFSKVKVQKKAKTYKAKVSVTYGTQTVTKTVQLVVKKK